MNFSRSFKGQDHGAASACARRAGDGPDRARLSRNAEPVAFHHSRQHHYGMRRDACARVAGDESDCARLAQPPERLARHHGRQHHHGKNRSGIFSRLCQAWLRCLRWLAYCRCDHDHEPVGVQWAVHYGGNGQTVQRKLDVHVHGAEQRVSDGSRSVGYQLLLWGVRVARLHIHGSGSGNMHHL